MLRSRADLQTLAYAAAATGVAVAQWNAERFHGLLFVASLVLAFAVSVMHHNHQHLPLWRHAALNHATDFWFTLFQGHPGFAFEPSHLKGHHTHRNSGADITRTWRLHDGNGLLGFIAHPVQFVLAVAPALFGYLQGLWRQDRTRLALIAVHYAWLLAVMAALFSMDGAKTVLFVLIPQLAALFFLLGANYLQHAHTDDLSRWNHSRNFTGLINPLFFNIGYHTAHHEHGEAHWSELPRLHAEIAPNIAPQLLERSFAAYCLRVFVLAPFVPHLRSRPVRGRLSP